MVVAEYSEMDLITEYSRQVLVDIFRAVRREWDRANEPLRPIIRRQLENRIHPDLLGDYDKAVRTLVLRLRRRYRKVRSFFQKSPKGQLRATT